GYYLRPVGSVDVEITMRNAGERNVYRSARRWRNRGGARRARHGANARAIFTGAAADKELERVAVTRGRSAANGKLSRNDCKRHDRRGGTDNVIDCRRCQQCASGGIGNGKR